MAVLLFLLVLFLLILVHEWGHFIVAKKTGMQVDEFGIGFPPKLWGIKKGETEYTFNLLPIGGFVRILGEDGSEESEVNPRSFTAKSKWAQAAVLIAGVSMNIIFAWFLFVLVFLIGVPSTVDEAEAGEGAALVISEVLNDSPAKNAGLTAGSVIYSVSNGEETLVNPTPSTFTALVEESVEKTLTVRLGSDGEQIVELTPEAGVLESAPERPAVGLALALVATKQYSFLAAVKEANISTYTTLVAITVGVTNLIASSLTLSADLSQVAGPIGIVGLVGDAAAFGLTSLMTFTAIISLNLAVINLLPFPALDGGRLLFVAAETVLRRPINPVWMARVNTIGFAFLILLMIAISVNDVARM
ncbi:site-2 protease family protein [Candidatus Kaiserbacteria bacterium]|nr:site-2 protease family protein [Candidatus Kaiserbacteria bacterium]MCB9811955.1 site-2 protease family protein [Candidatus Nomurabacteria bacterium]